MKRYKFSRKSYFMRFGNYILLFFLIAGLMSANPFINHASAKTQRLVDHVILIIPDGFSPDYMAMYDLPNLRSLANQGVFCKSGGSVSFKQYTQSCKHIDRYLSGTDRPAQQHHV